jgi:hypothetical protein
MTQLFLIIAFILGFTLGWKICELAIAQGITYLADMKDSGVEMDEKTNKLTIDGDLLKNFHLNKENIK